MAAAESLRGPQSGEVSSSENGGRPHHPVSIGILPFPKTNHSGDPPFIKKPSYGWKMIEHDGN